MSVKLQPFVLSILRIVSGIVLLGHGVQKAFGMFGGIPRGIPANTMLLLKTAGWMETVGAVCLIVGLFTVPVAFILSGEMAVAYFIGHVLRLGNLLVPMANGGEPAVLNCFIFLYLSIAGGGVLGLDAMFRKEPAVSADADVPPLSS